MSKVREMRRKRQQLSDEESIGILQKATAGTLALLDWFPKKIHKSLDKYRKCGLICNRVIISLGKKGTIEQETNTPEYEEDNNNNISIPIDVDELSAFSEGEWAGGLAGRYFGR